MCTTVYLSALQQQSNQTRCPACVMLSIRTNSTIVIIPQPSIGPLVPGCSVPRLSCPWHHFLLVCACLPSVGFTLAGSERLTSSAGLSTKKRQRTHQPATNQPTNTSQRHKSQCDGILWQPVVVALFSLFLFSLPLFTQKLYLAPHLWLMDRN